MGNQKHQYHCHTPINNAHEGLPIEYNIRQNANIRELNNDTDVVKVIQKRNILYLVMLLVWKTNDMHMVMSMGSNRTEDWKKWLDNTVRPTQYWACLWRLPNDLPSTVCGTQSELSVHRSSSGHWRRRREKKQLDNSCTCLSCWSLWCFKCFDTCQTAVRDTLACNANVIPETTRLLATIPRAVCWSITTKTSIDTSAEDCIH